MRFRMLYRSASPRPMSESAPLGRSAVPSLGQKRAVVSYSVPQCGQTLNTATGSSSAGVDCRASNPDPNPLSASARDSASRMARSSSEALGGGERSSELSCSSADIDIEYACYPLARKVVPANAARPRAGDDVGGRGEARG